AAGRGSPSGDPAQVVGAQPRRLQPRMVVPLHHVQGVAGHVLARGEPGRVTMATGRGAARLETADADALALSDRVEAQAHVFAERAAAVVANRPGRVREVTVEELAKRPLADEADAGRILFLRVRQADLG